jgi:type IV pilus assembly protein PilE
MMKDRIHKLQGFTLVELLITVAIVAILATFAYPAFQQFLLESRRADAYSALTALQLSQENLRGSCKHYALGGIGSNSCDPNDAGNTTVKGSTISRDGYYALTIEGTVSSAGNAYRLVATPVGAQANDTSCDPITLEVNTSFPNGLKSPTSCWE